MRFTGRFSIRRLLVVVMAVAASVVPLSPARAEGALTCVYEDTITVTPAVGFEEDEIRFASDGRGTLTCFGTLGDAEVAGTGWWTETGSGVGSRVEGVGSIDLVGVLPTADGGEVDVAGHLWAKRVGLTGYATGFINGVLVTGPYVVQPSVEQSPTSSTVTVRGIAASVPLQDRVAPPSPTDFEAEQSDSDVHLSWARGEGDSALPVQGYRVYRDREPIQIKEPLPAAVTTYIDSSVTAGTYTYTLAAVNDAGVESELAGPLSVTVVEGQPWAPQMFDPVMSPTDVKAKVHGTVRASQSLESDVLLRWKEPLIGQPDFYRVYSSRDPFQPIATVNESSYVDPDVDFSCDKSYTYYVTAVDATGTEAWSEPLDVGPFAESDAECL